MKSNPFTKDIMGALSPLEKEIIDVMAKGEKYGATDIYGRISKKRNVAKSSVSVILDRLHKKGLIQRETETARGGIRFLYYLRLNAEQFERAVVETTVKALIKRFGKNAIAYFNESFDKQGGRKND